MYTNIKRLAAVVLTTGLAITSSFNAFAKWEQVGTQWKYSDNNVYLVNGWHWIDGNNDGIAECYYFNTDGIMLSNTTTPDNFTVNENGAWVVNGVIQTKAVSVSQPSTGQQTQPSGNYRRPLYGDSEGWGSDTSAGSTIGHPTGLVGSSGNNATINGSQSNGGGTSNSGSSQSNGSSSNSSSKQQHGGVPDLDDIIAGVSHVDVDKVECGDSTGLPPMH